MTPPPNSAHLRAYLLGTLPSAEREALEERLLTDDTLFDELCALDDELIDAYHQGSLSRDERRRFGRRLHATRRGRRRLALHRFLDADASRRVEPRPLHRTFFTWLRAAPMAPALLAQAALLALVVGPLAWKNHQLDERLDVVLAEAGATRPPSEPAPTAPGDGLRPVEAIFDLPASSRSSAPRLAVPADLERLRLRVPLPPEIVSGIELTARLVADGERWSSDEVMVLDDELGSWAEVVIDTARLAPGLHSLVLERPGSGEAALVGRFSFFLAGESGSAPGS